jgi:glucosyl-dolichyl phosphate glucuronosyltransferase
MKSHRRTSEPAAIAQATASSTTATPDISVIVCTYNRYDVLPDALASLTGQTLLDTKAEIIVVDNSSDVRSQRRFWSDGPPAAIRVVFEPVPGLSRARNRGMREASAPVIAFLDDDAIAAADWCDALVQTFRRHTDAGIVGGPVRPIWPASEPKWLHQWQRGFLTIVDHGAEERPLNGGEWLAGTNIAFRSEALLEVGGFAEGLGRTGSTLLSNEELLTTSRLHERGFKSYYNPRAEVLHRVHAERVTPAWLRRRIAWQVVSDLLAGTPLSPAEEHWRQISDYFLSVTPELRTLRGLFYDTSDPELFLKQTEALKAVLHLALEHGNDPLRDGG